MKAVWSLWTKPLRSESGWTWPSQKHHLLAWVLSVETARRHYPETALFTDDEGAEMLIDGMGLGFDRVSTALNALHDRDPEWWALGKVYTYSLQSEPFVHIDTDVFLWNKLPDRLETADVFAQNPEYFDGRCMHYPLERIGHAINAVNGWLPKELSHGLSAGDWYKAANCGIMGGNRVDFIRYYAGLALKFMEDPRNRAAWSFLDHKWSMCCVFEQYLLTACIDYHRNFGRSSFGDVGIRYLFESESDAAHEAVRVGYTHLIAGAKQNLTLLDHVERRVRRDYPELYERCLEYIEKIK